MVTKLQKRKLIKAYKDHIYGLSFHDFQQLPLQKDNYGGSDQAIELQVEGLELRFYAAYPYDDKLDEFGFSLVDPHGQRWIISGHTHPSIDPTDHQLEALFEHVKEWLGTELRELDTL